MQADCVEFSVTATVAVEFRSSKSWQVRSWILAAISELMAAPRSPLTSDALACPSSALYRSAQLEPSRDSTGTVPSGPSAHKRGRLAMAPTAKTAANKTVVPMRMTNKVPVSKLMTRSVCSELNRAWVVPLKTTDFVDRHSQFAEFWLQSETFAPCNFERFRQGLPRISAGGLCVKTVANIVVPVRRATIYCKEGAEQCHGRT
jgi:hypothetical protein